MRYEYAAIIDADYEPSGIHLKAYRGVLLLADGGMKVRPVLTAARDVPTSVDTNRNPCHFGSNKPVYTEDLTRAIRAAAAERASTRTNGKEKS